MQTYIRIFLNLLLPLTLLFTVVSVGYFTLDYSFSKAFKLGILSGVFIGIGMSLITAFALLILRKVQKSKEVQTAGTEETTESTTRVETKTETKAVPDHKRAKPKSNPKHKSRISKDIKCMLLMDKELTFDVVLNALKDEHGCTLAKSDPKKGTITIQTKKGIIQTTITSLTQHTSQIILQTVDNVKQVKDLISHLKEKEHSFLQY